MRHAQSFHPQPDSRRVEICHHLELLRRRHALEALQLHGMDRFVHRNQSYASLGVDAGHPGRRSTAIALRAPFFSAQALRDEGQYQRVERNAFSFGTGGQLGVDRLGYPGNEHSAGDAAAVRRGNGQSPGFQRGDRRLQRVRAIRHRFFDGLSVGDAVRKVSVQNEKTTPRFLAQRANLERVVSKLGHGHAPSTSSTNILR